MSVNHGMRTYLDTGELLERAMVLRGGGYRLVQICATCTEGGFDVLYTFGKDLDVLHLYLDVRPGQHIPSLSAVFPSAYVFENEMSDLFGIPVEGMTHDYHGNFYVTPTAHPMSMAHVNPDGTVTRDGPAPTSPATAGAPGKGDE